MIISTLRHTRSVRMALSTQSTITPTSPKTAESPVATRMRIRTFTAMANVVFCRALAMVFRAMRTAVAIFYA